MAKSKSKQADVLEQKSPAEFFAENKNIAGFDNPGKCLYTTVRELVENSLDSAESINTLPEISVEIEEVSQESLNQIRGIDNHERLDEQLYQDYEDDAARKKRLAKEAKELERLQKAHAKKGGDAAELEGKVKELEFKRAAAAISSTKTFYKVTVKDNGAGMPHDDIPNLLGRVLSGTKYGVKQTRGKFGLGAKMALIWSKMSTGLPIKVWSAQERQTYLSHYKLDIDIHRNEPNVHSVAKESNENQWHGATLSVIILGNWQYYRSKILKYLRQIAVITPYTAFTFDYKARDKKNSVHIDFLRRSDKMPPPPELSLWGMRQATKHHPASVDLELVKRLVTTTRAPTLQAFLCREFSSISKEYAGRLISESRSGADPTMKPAELSDKQIIRLHQLLHEAKFDDPDGRHLSPAGEYNLRLGIMKELDPDLVATHQGDIRVLEGHAFIVEAAVSVGGRDMKQGINVHRFANRIPLLFEGGSDVITKTALQRINWTSYKINQSADKVGVFVSIVSTRIPYKGAGKEYIADDMDELVSAVRHAIQACCIQLKVKITKRIAAKEQQQRRKNLLRYIDSAAAAIFPVLQHLADTQPKGTKRRLLQEGDDMLPQVKNARITQQTLKQKLTEHVERIDTDMALEFQMQQGLAGSHRDDVYLAPRGPQHTYGPPLQARSCVIQLLL